MPLYNSLWSYERGEILLWANISGVYWQLQEWHSVQALLPNQMCFKRRGYSFPLQTAWSSLEVEQPKADMAINRLAAVSGAYWTPLQAGQEWHGDPNCEATKPSCLTLPYLSTYHCPTLREVDQYDLLE